MRYEEKEKYFKKNKTTSMLAPPYLTKFAPDIEWYITVEGLDVPKDLFPEEYNAIVTSYHSVLKKIKETNIALDIEHFEKFSKNKGPGYEDPEGEGI